MLTVMEAMYDFLYEKESNLQSEDKFANEQNSNRTSTTATPIPREVEEMFHDP